MPSKPERIFLSPPHMGSPERELLQEAFDSNWIAPVGPDLPAFEQALAERDIDARIHLVGCVGHCYAEPVVVIDTGRSTPSEAAAAIQAGIATASGAFLTRDGPSRMGSLPFFTGRRRGAACFPSKHV